MVDDFRLSKRKLNDEMIKSTMGKAEQLQLETAERVQYQG